MFKKTVLIVLVGVLSASIAFAGNLRVSGTVKNASGEAIAGASVSCKGFLNGVITADDGSFVLRGLSAGEKTLVVTYLGYKTKELDTELDKDIILQLVLDELAVLGDEVVVTAIKAGASAPFAVSNLNMESLRENSAGEELPSMINLAPSVVSVNENGTPFGNTTFRVRGSIPNRLNITVNGIPQNDAESMEVFWVNMTDFSESVDKAQLQRGVGASTNGTASFGGSLNLQTDLYSEKPRVEVNNSVGSFGTYKSSAIINSGLIGEHFNFEARASHLSSDGYMEHSALKHTSVFFSGGYFSKNTTLKMIVWNNNEKTGLSWNGVPDFMMNINRRYNSIGLYIDKDGAELYYPNETDNYIQTNSQLHFSQKLSESLTLNAAVHYTRGDGYYEQIQDDANLYHTSSYAFYGLPNATYIATPDTIRASDNVQRRAMANDFYGATWSLNYKLSNLALSLGGNANRYDGDNFGKVIWWEYNPGVSGNYEYYRGTTLKDEYNVFTKAQYSISENLHVFADLQYRGVKYDITGLNSDRSPLDVHKNYPFFNPKTGVSYSVRQHSVYASYAKSHREPTGIDLKNYVDGVLVSPKSESMDDYEAGYVFRSNTFTGSANLYYMNYKDQLVPTGIKNDVGYDVMTNVAESYRMGVELATAWQPFHFIRWDFNTTLSKNEIKNFEETLTYYDVNWNWLEKKTSAPRRSTLAYSPSLICNNSLTISPFQKFNVILSNKYVGKQYYDNTGDELAALDAYFLTDIALGYSFVFKHIPTFELRLKAANITSAKVSTNAYGGRDMVDGVPVRWSYYYPLAPINYLAQLRIIF